MILLNRLSRDQRGTSAMEFALVAPMLAFLTVGITDVARAVGQKFVMEQAVYRTMELVTVGSLKSDYEYVEPEAEAALREDLGVDEDDADIEVLTWLECDGVKQAAEVSATSTCPGTQEVARFVQVDIESYFEPVFGYGPFGKAFTGNEGGRVRLASTSTLRVK